MESESRLFSFSFHLESSLHSFNHGNASFYDGTYCRWNHLYSMEGTRGRGMHAWYVIQEFELSDISFRTYESCSLSFTQVISIKAFTASRHSKILKSQRVRLLISISFIKRIIQLLLNLLHPLVLLMKLIPVIKVSREGGNFFIIPSYSALSRSRTMARGSKTITEIVNDVREKTEEVVLLSPTF